MNRLNSFVRPRTLVALEVDAALARQADSGERDFDVRRMAILADRASDLDISLAPLWRELVDGHARLVDVFFTEDRCYLVLGPTQVTLPLTGRRREILEAVLCGVGQKCVASEQRLAVSSIAMQARLALEQLGLSCKTSRAHPLLMLLARAGSRHDERVRATLSFVETGHEQLRVVAMGRPDLTLARSLPPAELEAARLLIEGFSYQDIAQLRDTAMRTTANQIAAVFRRLRVSGRNELVARLFFTEECGQSPPSRAAFQPKSAVGAEIVAQSA
jgi:DNA-binding NarL/FixJ family response regulator